MSVPWISVPKEVGLSVVVGTHLLGFGTWGTGTVKLYLKGMKAVSGRFWHMTRKPLSQVCAAPKLETRLVLTAEI